MTVRSVSPSGIARLYTPSKCELRAWLKARGEVEEAEPGPFQRFLQDQGVRHEARVLEILRSECEEWVDIRGFDNPNALEETEAAVWRGGELICQGRLEVETTEIFEAPVRMFGYPDFMVPIDGGYRIIDAKLARSIHETKADGSIARKSNKKYIVLQLQLYGWMFERQFPDLEFELEVYNGALQKEQIDFTDGGNEAMTEVARLLGIEDLGEEPPEPVGWSKCGGCGFSDYCWPRAEQRRALGLVPDLTQALERKLEARGIDTYLELGGRMDGPELADLKNISAGSDDPDNLEGAERILENVRALITRGPIRRRRSGELVPLDPSVYEADYYVMFDLEGVPPELEETEKVYLWGMQVFGLEKGPFLPAFAGFGENGDSEGWGRFLQIARGLLDDHPAIRFVHWAKYEKAKISSYIDRYPDSDLETAEEVRESLLDLLPITKEVVALPLPSYSLKVVEALPQLVEVTGFSRSAEDVTKGDDSIAAYMEAVEAGDGPRRDELMDQLAAYNQEDLEATWAVQTWLCQFAGPK